MAAETEQTITKFKADKENSVLKPTLRLRNHILLRFSLIFTFFSAAFSRTSSRTGSSVAEEFGTLSTLNKVFIIVKVSKKKKKQPNTQLELARFKKEITNYAIHT